MSEPDRTVAHSGEKSSRRWWRGHSDDDASRLFRDVNADTLGLDFGRHVSIFANGGMLAPNLNGDEILAAARRFFPSRLMRWQLGPRNAECSAWDFCNTL